MPGLPEPRPAEPAAARGSFPLGAAVTRAELDADPHPVLARLRAAEPVSWLPALGGWLITSRQLALRVLRDSATFTVDDPRFSTARVVGRACFPWMGPSMAVTARRSAMASVTARSARGWPAMWLRRRTAW